MAASAKWLARALPDIANRLDVCQTAVGPARKNGAFDDFVTYPQVYREACFSGLGRAFVDAHARQRSLQRCMRGRPPPETLP
ncbi:hypothetical protein C8C98_3197 [Acidovorax sp. 106]|nr:hypothetical protein C8C98_3197 [Acidovorax sp. 106]